MTETSIVVVCADSGTFWAAGEPPQCTDADHHHVDHEVHRHRTPVVLPDGAEVTAASFDASDPYTRDAPPDHGLYLDARWSPPWAHDHVDWPDFGVPTDPAGLLTALAVLRARAHAGERVELGCLGGHGRTGTALACLAVLSGAAPTDAVAWVRANYCSAAVETDEQADFVSALRP